VKRFVDGRCVYCGGFNHRAAECAARKKAQTIKVLWVPSYQCNGTKLPCGMPCSGGVLVTSRLDKREAKLIP